MRSSSRSARHPVLRRRWRQVIFWRSSPDRRCRCGGARVPARCSLMCSMSDRRPDSWTTAAWIWVSRLRRLPSRAWGRGRTTEDYAPEVAVARAGRRTKSRLSCHDGLQSRRQALRWLNRDQTGAVNAGSKSTSDVRAAGAAESSPCAAYLRFEVLNSPGAVGPVIRCVSHWSIGTTHHGRQRSAVRRRPKDCNRCTAVTQRSKSAEDPSESLAAAGRASAGSGTGPSRALALSDC